MSRSPSTSGRWNSRQRWSQSSDTSLVQTSIKAPPAAAVRSGRARQLARRAVDGVLDCPVVELALLDPAGRELEQLSEDQLRVGAADADRESKHSTAEGAPQLGEHALVVTHVVVGQRVGQILQQLALLCG